MTGKTPEFSTETQDDEPRSDEDGSDGPEQKQAAVEAVSAHCQARPRGTFAATGVQRFRHPIGSGGQLGLSLGCVLGVS
jgi:hypothetical protein